MSNEKAPESPGASREPEMGFVGNGSTISVCDYTTPRPISSTVKTVLIAVLAAVYEHSPALAAALAHVVEWGWRGFRGI